MIRDLSGIYEPQQINEICFQYKIWSYISKMEDVCKACGTHMPIGSKSTTGTCSNRCHQVVKRAKAKNEQTPIESIQEEAMDKLESIRSVWDKAKQHPYRSEYPWHKVDEGWKVIHLLN